MLLSILPYLCNLISSPVFSVTHCAEFDKPEYLFLTILPFLPGRDWTKKGVPRMAMEPAMMRSNNTGDRTIIAIKEMISSKHLLKNFAYPTPLTQNKLRHFQSHSPTLHSHLIITGQTHTRPNISIPTSSGLPFLPKFSPLIYAFVFPLPSPSLVTNLFCW